MCDGGNSFNELKVIQGLGINNGSVLVNGRIPWVWQNILFWRSFLVMTLHYICILLTGSISLKLGFVTQTNVESQNPEVIDPHPNDNDTLTMFAFIKQ
jgi:hypothetical protein